MFHVNDNDPSHVSISTVPRWHQTKLHCDNHEGDGNHMGCGAVRAGIQVECHEHGPPRFMRPAGPCCVLLLGPLPYSSVARHSTCTSLFSPFGACRLLVLSHVLVAYKCTTLLLALSIVSSLMEESPPKKREHYKLMYRGEKLVTS